MIKMEYREKTTIDEIDRKILRELQVDCKLSSRELSKKLNMPITTVHQRIVKLKSKGVIKSFSGIINPESVNLGCMAIVFVHTKTTKIGKKIYGSAELAEDMAKIPGVLEVHMITGRYDVMLKIRAENERMIGNEVASTIRALPGVVSTETFIVVNTAKETMNLPL
jgi:Lrp/AsnC family transcriptional regulator for asnA, asnC and gidA